MTSKPGLARRILRIAVTVILRVSLFVCLLMVSAGIIGSIFKFFKG